MLDLTLLAEHDDQFARHAVAGLRMTRVDFMTGQTPPPVLDIVFATTLDGALMPHPRSAVERVLITILGAVQVLVSRDRYDEEIRLTNDAFDAAGLVGSVAVMCQQQAMRRVASGVGACVFTGQRAIGLISEHPRRRRGRDRHRAGTPTASVHGAIGSIVVLSCHRGAFSTCEIPVRRVSTRARHVNVVGDCSLALDVHKMVGGCGERLIEPTGSEINVALGPSSADSDRRSSARLSMRHEERT